ncbi:MAG: transposase [Arsenophonus sp. NEOnobi-MAG3]
MTSGLSSTGSKPLTQKEMIWRYISHIPSRHVKMMRYYSFL